MPKRCISISSPREGSSYPPPLFAALNSGRGRLIDAFTAHGFRRRALFLYLSNCFILGDEGYEMKQQQPLTIKRHKIARDSKPTVILPFISVAATFLHMPLTIMLFISPYF